MDHPTCACGRTFTDQDRMGATAYTCPQCGSVWRPAPEPAAPPPPSPPKPARSSALRGVLGCLLALGLLVGMPYGMWTCAKAVDRGRGGSSGPPVTSGSAFPKEVFGPLLRVPSGGIEGTRFSIGASGERLVAYVEMVSGPEVTIHVMTTGDYESAKARWGKEFITEYKRLQGFTMSARDRIRLYTSDGLMPPGNYVLALIGGNEESGVRVQVKTER